MISDAEKTIAFLFKRSGKKEMKYSDFYLTLSMDLNWFTPEDAKDFINKALEGKLLEKKDETIRPGFNVDKINVPLGFIPSKTLFEEKTFVQKPIEEKDILSQMIKKISNATKIKEEEIFASIKKIENEKNLTPEVAALLFGKEYNVSLEEFFDEVEKQIF